MIHVNGWCFRGIYKGGLWEEDLHVSAQKESADKNPYRHDGRAYSLSISILAGCFHFRVQSDVTVEWKN